MIFNLRKHSGPRRIKDRGINWKEAYREKSDDLKHRYEQMLGPGSYYRWEGHDYTTNSDYFVVAGPAITKEGRKMFFAGIKKLPPGEDPSKHFAPSGEYFGSMNGALSHASNKWGIRFPQGNPNYQKEQLAPLNIPRHVKADSSVQEKYSQHDPQAIKDFLGGLGSNFNDSYKKKVEEYVNKVIESINQGQDPQRSFDSIVGNPGASMRQEIANEIMRRMNQV